MKKLIPFSLVTVAILAPNIALSQPSELFDFSEKEITIIKALLCSEEDSSKEELMQEIAYIDGSFSSEEREKLANAVIMAENLPKKFENKTCKP